MPRAKLAGTYANSILANLEVTEARLRRGAAARHPGLRRRRRRREPLHRQGRRIYEPEIASALTGITRDSIHVIARELGYEVITKRLTRDDIYLADEAFFTGTAAEVTPIRELDDRNHRRRQARPGHREDPGPLLRRGQWAACPKSPRSSTALSATVTCH
jgi:branched-chain amino acid aminotransferase